MLATALWISLLPNAATLVSFYRAGESATAFAHVAFVAGGWLVLFSVTMLLLALLGMAFWRSSIRYLCAIALIAAAVLGYFSLFLGTQFDKTMLLNMMQTHASETFELVNLRLLVWTLLIGVFPAIVVLRVPMRFEATRVGTVAVQAGIVASLVALSGVVVFAQYSRYASAGRARAITFHTVAPTNLIAASVSYAYAQRVNSIVREPRGLDAHQGYALKKLRLVVMLLGETTRAQNWGLNGYERDTTPRLRAANVINFPEVSSCGTATAISLPCIFSGLKREEFSLLKAAGRETLIDVVAHSGARVIWRDNDAGCKGVCDRIDVEDFTNAEHEKWCPEKGECFDEILFEGLEKKIRESEKDTFVVLHLKGSHGPAYYKRYPKRFERFVPTCQTSDLAGCDREQLRNAYDNTVFYADHIGGETIELLTRLSDKFAGAMLFVSDHGESLGESGLFLHGMPYAVAPKEQTRVPMVAWLSPQFTRMGAWDTKCLSQQTQSPRSHDNVYSTMLGLMEIETNEYNKVLDVFSVCDAHLPLVGVR